MKTLVIHDLQKEYLDFPLDNYILTFDDALYSQYYYWPLINDPQTQKILFVSPCLVNKTLYERDQFSGDYRRFPDCFEAMRMYRDNNNTVDYMTVGEIKHLINEGVTIGAHSFSHFQGLNLNLFELTKFIKEDTKRLLEWFDEYLGFQPVLYAFPHFEEYFMQRAILKEYGFKKFFGNERILIENITRTKKDISNK
jgi:peptidoglycan/xylan/chitin deacetylase (PgdA/CDA1 family)